MVFILKNLWNNLINLILLSKSVPGVQQPYILWIHLINGFLLHGPGDPEVLIQLYNTDADGPTGSVLYPIVGSEAYLFYGMRCLYQFYQFDIIDVKH